MDKVFNCSARQRSPFVFVAEPAVVDDVVLGVEVDFLALDQAFWC